MNASGDFQMSPDAVNMNAAEECGMLIETAVPVTVFTLYDLLKGGGGVCGGEALRILLRIFSVFILLLEK